MHRHYHWLHEPDEKVAQRQTASLLGVVIVLLLLISGLFLVKRLSGVAVVEDCLLARHQNCDVLISGHQ